MTKKRVYPIKVDKQLIKKLKPYWKRFDKLQDSFLEKVYKLEKEMSEATGIRGVEFFSCDGYYCGIGNEERTIRLIHDEELA